MLPSRIKGLKSTNLGVTHEKKIGKTPAKKLEIAIPKIKSFQKNKKIKILLVLQKFWFFPEKVQAPKYFGEVWPQSQEKEKFAI